jgi:UDP-4-amino-4,6-dideoxy-N-acetyl-beta-L-altrosamine transaminase
VIPYGRQWIDDDDVAAVVHALRSDFLTTGPTIAEFERALQDVTGAPFATTMSSGTAALHGVMTVLGLGSGDEVIMPPLTFAATANAALYVGATPVFADVDPGTGLLDPAAVASALTPRTRAVVAVDYGGLPADYSAIREAVADHDVVIVADAAHSLGATDSGRSVGTLADITTLSFHPVKLITTGEGGAILTSSSEWHERASHFRSHGMEKDPSHLSRRDGPWYHEMQSLGYNYRLTDIQAALGLSQLGKLPKFLRRRREIAARYDQAFGSNAGLLLPGRREGAESAWHLYVLRVADNPPSRRQFFDRLSALGIGVQVHYLPVHKHPYYQARGYDAVHCPVAENYYERAVSIPMFPAMTDADVDRVIEAVQQATEAAAID